MIVKYFDDGVWGYIDNVRQVASSEIDCEELIKQYDEDVKSGIREDIVHKDVATSDTLNCNKVFLMASEKMEDIRGNCSTVNLLDSNNLDIPTFNIVLYLEEHKEYDTLVLITNQKCYLMNDKGQTIERLA